MNDATLIKDFLKYGKANNLNQTELAKLLGVTRETLFRWGTGKVKMRASNKRAIIKIASSPEFVGEFLFRQFSKLMI